MGGSFHGDERSGSPCWATEKSLGERIVEDLLIVLSCRKSYYMIGFGESAVLRWLSEGNKAR